MERVFNRHGIEADERSIIIERAEIEQVQQDKLKEEEIFEKSGSVTPQVNFKIKDINAGTKLDFEIIK